MAKHLLMLAAAAAWLCSSAPAAGADVHGRILDSSGSPLPGVLVSLRSPSGVITATSDESGRYQATCPPGTYALRAELQGFEPVARAVTVADDGLSLDFVLTVAGYAEQVTVKAEAPPAVLGPPHPDAPVTVTRQVVDAGMLPNSQYDDVLPLLPNVVRGPDGQISVAGARAPQSALFVNGFNETDPIVGEPRLMLPLEAVDAMDVFAGGYDAELGPATGGVTAVHTRSGTDAMHLSATSFMPRLRFPDGRARVESWEPNVGASGPIARGRAFFEQSLSYRYDVERFDTLAGPQENSFDALLSWTQADVQVAPGQRLSATLSLDPQRTDHANITAFTPRDTVPAVEQGGWSLNLADRLVIGRSAVAEIRASTLRSRLSVTPSGSQSYELAHDVVRGSYFDRQDVRGDRVEAGGDVTWTGWRRHVVKAGGSVGRATIDGSAQSSPVMLLASDGSTGRVIAFAGGLPTQRASEETAALYVQDTWTPWMGATIDAGVRYDRSSVLRGGRVLPRAAWTLTLGDGRWTISGSAGLFADKVPLRAQLFPDEPSRVVETHGPLGDRVSAQLLANTIDDRLWMPLAVRWDVEIERQSASGWLGRVRYQERRGRDEAIVTPVAADSGSGLMLLTSSGRSQSRSLEATAAYRAPRAGDQIYLSYVRSAARGDLNGFDLVEGTFRQPLVERDAVGPLPADVPDRFLAWGLLRLPARIEVAPFIEVRDGFPYSAIGDDWLRSEAPNARRFPWFGSMDLYVNRVFGLPFHLPDARVGLKIYNLASVHTERDVQADVERADFGHTSNAIPRDYTAVLELLWGR